MKKYFILLGVVTVAFTIASYTSKNNQANEKVIVCHIPPGNPANAHDIEISINALPAHLAHGDYEGGCHVGG
ncbi:hypothetical protein [Flavobacterium sp.]|uniref:hypothetical protein n=1 Tax=Flavobacterium sp. TaxID=239 RepID=UPI00260E28CB|nr:hypothetical protein [Flavobacterium sp.]